MKSQDYISNLERQFKANSDREIAKGQEAYMRNQFKFFGIKTTKRRELQKPFLDKDYLPPRKELGEIIKILWDKPEREFQYFGQELLFRCKKETVEADILLFEYMITHRSWWDTVDFIAANLVGEYFKKFPDQTASYADIWVASGNIWLQRTAVLFMLKYKKETDTVLLASTINALLGSKEFFINKAIGWALREYSKSDPEWVLEFTGKTELSKLSRGEGLRLINKWPPLRL